MSHQATFEATVWEGKKLSNLLITSHLQDLQLLATQNTRLKNLLLTQIDNLLSLTLHIPRTLKECSFRVMVLRISSCKLITTLLNFQTLFFSSSSSRLKTRCNLISSQALWTIQRRTQLRMGTCSSNLLRTYKTCWSSLRSKEAREAQDLQAQAKNQDSNSNIISQATIWPPHLTTQAF